MPSKRAKREQGAPDAEPHLPKETPAEAEGERGGRPEKDKAKKKGRKGGDGDDRAGSSELGQQRYPTASADDEKTRNKLKVHLARFFEYQPQIVTAMAYDAPSQMLAVARGDGDIQLWNTVAPRWHAVGVLTGSSPSPIRSVCWARREGEPRRLFSGSLDGAITEWSLESLGPVSVTDSQGGSVWCLAVSHSGERLAAACHDGGVRIFNLAEHVPGLASSEGVVFQQLLPRHPGEALSVAWGFGDRVLVTGDSHGVLRVWQLGKERSGIPPTVQTVSVASNTGSGGFKKAALIWAVAVHADMTVWAADSKGNTHVIDAKMGLVVKRFVSHHGSDVLALAAHGLNDCFSGGVDGRVVHYRRVSTADSSHAGGQWVVVGAARFHTHDIRCLCVAGNFFAPGGGDDKRAADFEVGKRVLKAEASGRKIQALNVDRMGHCLVSAGLDTQLGLYTYDLSHEASSRAPRALTPSMRLPPWPFQSCVSLSGPVKHRADDDKTCEVRMVAWQADAVDVWRWKLTRRGSMAAPLPHASRQAVGTQPADRDREWVDEPRYAVRIQAAAGGGRMTCAAVSPDGQWVACGLASRLALYRVSEKPDDGLDVVKCQLSKKLRETGVRALVFLPDSRTLVVAQTSGVLLVVALDSLQVRTTLRPRQHLMGAAGAGLISKSAPAANGQRDEAGGGDGDGGADTSSGGVNRLCVSGDGRWLASGDVSGRVLTWRLPAALSDSVDEVLPVCVPALPGGVTAMRFRPSTPSSGGGAAGAASASAARSHCSQLVLVTAENALFLFDADRRKLTAAPQHGPSAPAGRGKAASLLLHPHHCQSMTFNPRQPSSLILWGCVAVCCSVLQCVAVCC